MSSDRYPAALWLVARFLYEPTADDLDVSDPSGVLSAARQEIETEIAAMLRGGKNHARVTALACGAAALLECAPLTGKTWIAAASPLRAPAVAREYNGAFDFVHSRINIVKRIARVLANEGKISAAQALWLADAPPQRRAA